MSPLQVYSDGRNHQTTCGISSGFPGVSPAHRQVRYVFLTRPPLPVLRRSVRLACVRHAASVDPEPGSNSRLISLARCSTHRVVSVFRSRFGSSGEHRGRTQSPTARGIPVSPPRAMHWVPVTGSVNPSGSVHSSVGNVRPAPPSPTHTSETHGHGRQSPQDVVHARCLKVRDGGAPTIVGRTS
jgi:hypothetical protein